MTSVTIPLVFALTRFKTLNLTLRVLFIFLIISAVTEFLSFFLLDKNSDIIFAVQNIYTFLEYVFLVCIYFLEYTSKTMRKIILYFSFAYLIGTIVILFLLNRFTELNDVLNGINSFVMIALSVYFFYKIQSELNIPSLNQYPFFWFNCAILIYFGTSLILFLCGDYLDKCDIKEFQVLWSLHFIGNIIYNILFAIGLWKAK